MYIIINVKAIAVAKKHRNDAAHGSIFVNDFFSNISVFEAMVTEFSGNAVCQKIILDIPE